MKQFAEWLSTTGPSVFIQTNNSWAIPLIQSIHIIGIAVVFGSIFLMDLRILGLAGMDQSLRQTNSRYGPWMTGSLWLLLVTGVLMVIGEPVRELVTFSFWLKMALIVLGTIIAAIFRVSLRNDSLTARGSVKAMAVFTLLIWATIIVLGRLIAYDQVWGSWSPAAA
ncbi:MAG: DUF6644 family protein [Bryobacteraceae bacterium]